MRTLRSAITAGSDPSLGRVSPSLPAGLAPRAAERLIRLKTDLDLGLPVLLSHDGSVALVALVERLSEDRLTAMRAMGRPQLALTRHRVSALNRTPLPAGDVLRVGVPDRADLGWLRATAGDGPALEGTPHPVEVLNAGTPIDRAATALATAVQVLPAALILPLSGTAEAACRLELSLLPALEALETLASAPLHTRVSSARVPTGTSATGRVHVFRPPHGGVEHSAIEVGAPDLSQPVTVRLHSACFTGDVLGSVKCDCGPQLQAAMETMAAGNGGVLLYLNQEGRGIGLANKMRAYALQDVGLDTVEANNWLGFEDDLRDFRTGARMLQMLGIARVRLMTNNPAKVTILARHGIDVVERVPLRVGKTKENARYLATKAEKSGHLL